MSDHSVYLYAIGDAAIADSEVLVDTTGVDAAAVHTLVEGPLAAVVAAVDRDRFSEESIRTHLEDLEWLEKVARTHHEVVDRIARVHPIAPVRMATIYLDDAGVRQLLRDRAAELAATLDRVRGRSEWGVKGYAAPAETSAAEPAASASDAPGTSYLMRRRTERDRVARRRERVAETAEKLHQEFAQLAADSRVYPLQDPRLTGRREEMILNVAYLVDEAGAAALAQRVDAATGNELRLELTGPWAPYSFTSLGDS
ncbi:GvpL/GvpF family gas vesicle protein [Mycobacterium sp. URHB0021]